MHNIPSDIRWPRIVVSWRLGSNMFQGSAGLMDTCHRNTRSYSVQLPSPCLGAFWMMRLAYASIWRVKESCVLKQYIHVTKDGTSCSLLLDGRGWKWQCTLQRGELAHKGSVFCQQVPHVCKLARLDPLYQWLQNWVAGRQEYQARLIARQQLWWN